MSKVLFLLMKLNIGGLERMQITVANALARRGHDVTVMTATPGEELKSELDPRVRFIAKPVKPHLGRRIPYIRHVLYADGVWETRASAKRLHAYYIGKEHYDVEIAFQRGQCLKTISGYPAKKKGEPDTVHIAWVHNDYREATGYANNFRSMEQVKAAYRRMDAIVCVSREAKEGFSETIGDFGNLKVIYNMLPIEEIRQKASLAPAVPVRRASFHIVLVARLKDSAKGQIRMASVVRRLRDEGFDVSLALVGGGEDEAKIRAHIESLGADEYITMTGAQKNPYPYIREADLLVCASYYEGFNLTVAEALALGTPVLSTDCAGPNEILDGGRYGMLTENSEEGIYRGLRALLERPEQLASWHKSAAQRGAFFDETRIVGEIEALFCAGGDKTSAENAL